MNPSNDDQNKPDSVSDAWNNSSPQNNQGPVEQPTSDFGPENDSSTNPTESSSESVPETTAPAPQEQINPIPVNDSTQVASEQSEPTPLAPVGGPATIPEKKKNKKLIVILGSALLVAGLATAGYFIWQSLQPAGAPAASETDTTNEADPAPAPVETAEDVQNEIDAIQSDIDAISDEDFSEAPITDDSLNAQ